MSIPRMRRTSSACGACLIAGPWSRGWRRQKNSTAFARNSKKPRLDRETLEGTITDRNCAVRSWSPQKWIRAWLAVAFRAALGPTRHTDVGVLAGAVVADVALAVAAAGSVIACQIVRVSWTPSTVTRRSQDSARCNRNPANDDRLSVAAQLKLNCGCAPSSRVGR